MPPYPDFIDGSYTVQSPITAQMRTVNWYLERSESPGSTSAASLWPTPGYATWVTTASVGGRAMFAMAGRCFGVVGDTLYEFLANQTAVNRGTVAVDANPATICSNGDGGGELFVTSGGNGYVYDLTLNTLTQISGLVATMGGMLYGYFVAFDQTASKIRISDLFDGTTWDPTQFAQRTIGADPWTAMLVTPYGQIFLPGSQTSEFWYNSGAFPFPFAPDPSGLVEEGIAATFSVQQAGKSSVWLSTNRNGGYQVMRATGFTPQRISDHGVEFAIAGYSTITDAVGQTYEDQGHAFYILTFPTAMATWVYDFSTGRWHERMTWLNATGTEDYEHAIFHCFAFNTHLMADRTTGVIYRMDNTLTTDVDGREIRRIRRAPALVNQNTRMTFPSFEVLLEAGIANQVSPGNDPQVMMRKSDDGGQTWSNYRQTSAGKIGQYGTRVRFLNTGQARKRVFEISVTDAINNWRLTDAYLRVQKGTEAA